jgi:hypothetical protein
MHIFVVNGDSSVAVSSFNNSQVTTSNEILMERTTVYSFNIWKCIN